MATPTAGNRSVSILVIVDSTVVESGKYTQGRHSFWPTITTMLPEVTIEQISLPELRQQQRFLEIVPATWDIVVFNWDVVDGDATFQSDVTQNLLLYHYHTPLQEYVAQGGIVIIEAQASYWSPDQQAYDSILGVGEVICKQSKGYAKSGTTVFKDQAYEDHPALAKLPPEILSQYRDFDLSSWFPEDSVDNRVIASTNPTKLYHGCFLRWRNSWVPLLRDDQNNAVLLVKSDGFGTWFVSTMFLASSRNKPLLRTLLVDSLPLRVPIASYQTRLARTRWLFSTTVFLASTIATYFAVTYIGEIYHFLRTSKAVHWFVSLIVGTGVIYFLNILNAKLFANIFRKYVNK